MVYLDQIALAGPIPLDAFAEEMESMAGPNLMPLSGITGKPKEGE